MRLDPPTPTPRHARVRDRDVVERLLALGVVGVFGVALLQVTEHQPRHVPAATAAMSVGAATYGSDVGPQARVVAGEGRPVVAPAAVHAAAKPAARAVHAPARKTAKHRATTHRFVPRGTGMWIYQWHDTAGGRAPAVVQRARRVGLSTLYLRTGSSWDGFTAGHSLPALLRATRGTTVRVVAWDFPRLRRPAHDARRLVHAAWLGRAHHGPHVAAVAPDIETPAEGTYNAAWRVRLYLHVLRKHLPRGVTILSTVPWPSSYRLGDYPYRTVAAHSDVLVPMAYWYNNPPGLVTARSIHYLRRFHKPVAPVGQGYDGKLDVPSLRHNNLAREVPVFLRTAAHAGARAVSIWSWQSAKPATWRALARAHRLFASHR